MTQSSLLYYDKNGRAYFKNKLLHGMKQSTGLDTLRILEKASNAAYLTDCRGKTLLHYAAESANCNVLQYLINSGGNVNAQDSEGKTPLMSTFPPRCKSKTTGTLDTLFEANADIHICDNNGASVLSRYLGSEYAVMFLTKISNEYSGDIEKIARKLIDCNCSIYCAVALKNAAVTRILLENGCPISPPNHSYGLEDALVKCICNNDLENIKVLLDFGADVNAENIYGITSLYECGKYCCAFRKPNFELLRLLLDRGANSNKIITKGSSQGKMQMYNILERGTTESIRVLLERNIDLKAKDQWGRTALHYLSENRSINISELLKGKEFDVHARDNNGSTPLHSDHVIEANLSTIKFLLNEGANVNAKDYSGKTPLMRIWHIYNHEFFNYLLGYWQITVEKSKQVVECLLRHGAGLDLFGTDGLQFFTIDNMNNRWHLHWMESVLAQSAIDESRGIFTEELIKSQIVMYDSLKGHFDTCKQQVYEMNQVKVAESITLYELLIASEAQAEIYVRKKKLLRNLHRLKYKNVYMPYYRYILRDRVVKAIKTVERRENMAGIICEVIGLSADHIVAHEIVQYLSDSDLRKIYC